MKSALKKIPEKISELLASHVNDLEEAWANCGSESLTISMSAKIGFDKQSHPICEVGIAFVKERVKDSKVFNWDNKQTSMSFAKDDVNVTLRSALMEE